MMANATHETTGGPAKAAAKANGLTKKEAVRRALAKLGPQAKPAELQAHIKKAFGIEMTTDHVSTCKGDILRKEGAPVSVGLTAAKKPAAAKPAAPKSAAAKAAMPSGISLSDVRTTKELVERYGAAALRTLIDLLAK